MKIFNIVLFTLFLSVTIKAQDVSECFIRMPDSLLHYIPQTDRIMLTRIINEKSDTLSFVENKWTGRSWISYMDKNLIVFHPTEAVEWEIAKLNSGADSMICVIRTYKAEDIDSRVSIYDKEWNYLYDINLRNTPISINEEARLSDKCSNEIISELPMLRVSFDKNDINTVIISHSFPLLSKEEKETISQSYLQTKLKWNGKTFK